MNKKIGMAARYLLGVIFVVFGLNGFLQFLPMPQMSPAGVDFISALARSGYMFPVIKIVEIAGGAMLLSGMYVPMALVLLAPIVLNIFLFHAILDMGGLVMAIVILACELYLAYGYKDSFKGLFNQKAKAKF